MITLKQGDCLELMKELKDESGNIIKEETDIPSEVAKERTEYLCISSSLVFLCMM